MKFTFLSLVLVSPLLAHPGHTDAFSGFAHAVGDVEHIWAVPLLAVILGAAFFIRARRRSQPRI